MQKLFDNIHIIIYNRQRKQKTRLKSQQGEKMKKLITLLSLALCVVMLCTALVGCGNKTKYVANAITGVDAESYGYAVKKGENAAIIAACNEVIGDAGFQAKVDELVTFYTAVYGGETPKALSFELPDLSDNTAGTLKVGTEAGFAPFEFSSSDYGVDGVAGLDVAVMMMVAEKLNYTMTISDMNFDSLPAALESGTIDVIAAGFTNNEERAQKMDFSADYFTSTQFIVCKEDANYTKLEDLKDLKIAVQMGTTGDFLISDEIDAGNLGNAEAIPYKSITLAMQALKKGDIDCIVIDELPAKSLLNANK